MAVKGEGSAQVFICIAQDTLGLFLPLPLRPTRPRNPYFNFTTSIHRKFFSANRTNPEQTHRSPHICTGWIEQLIHTLLSGSLEFNAIWLGK